MRSLSLRVSRCFRRLGSSSCFFSSPDTSSVVTPEALLLFACLRELVETRRGYPIIISLRKSFGPSFISIPYIARRQDTALFFIQFPVRLFLFGLTSLLHHFNRTDEKSMAPIIECSSSFILNSHVFGFSFC